MLSAKHSGGQKPAQDKKQKHSELRHAERQQQTR